MWGRARGEERRGAERRRGRRAGRRERGAAGDAGRRGGAAAARRAEQGAEQSAGAQALRGRARGGAGWAHGEKRRKAEREAERGAAGAAGFAGRCRTQALRGERRMRRERVGTRRDAEHRGQRALTKPCKCSHKGRGLHIAEKRRARRGATLMDAPKRCATGRTRQRAAENRTKRRKKSRSQDFILFPDNLDEICRLRLF